MKIATNHFRLLLFSNAPKTDLKQLLHCTLKEKARKMIGKARKVIRKSDRERSEAGEEREEEEK